MDYDLPFFSQLDKIDWLIILTYILITLLVGVYFRKKAGSDVSSYFVSGRNLPWWLLGTSMVATTFAADTPLAVSGWIRSEGIWKNWFWWNYVFSHVFIIFVFSRLWRRSEVLTDNELIEFRYSGRPAAFLRGFKAFYFSTIFNFIVIGWVVSAMSKVLGVFFGIDKVYAVTVCLGIAFVYTMLSGLWGVVVTDFIQYILALAGTIIFAIIVVNSPEIGGYSSFIEKLNDIEGKHLKMFISSCDTCNETGFMSSNLFTFLIFVTVVWWSSHNADGGGYFIQRFLSAKNEKHAVLGMIWFVFNHYIVRFWPWVVVAVASLIVYPTPEVTSGDQETIYVLMIREFLGPGLKGLLLVTFIAAFMSTVSTQLNLGASYLLNDVYRRFINRNGSDAHYISASRLLTFLLTVVSGIIAFQIKNIGDAWIFVWAMSAGIGLVLVLRWFWWRINAWSEIVALSSSLFSVLIIIIFTRYMGYDLEFKYQVLVIPISITCWVVATFITSPEPKEKLGEFYQKVRPWGFWSPISSIKSEVKVSSFFPVLINWLLGNCAVIAALTGTGKVIFGSFNEGVLLIVLSLCVSSVLYFRLKKDFSSSDVK